MFSLCTPVTNCRILLMYLPSLTVVMHLDLSKCACLSNVFLLHVLTVAEYSVTISLDFKTLPKTSSTPASLHESGFRTGFKGGGGGRIVIFFGKAWRGAVLEIFLIRFAGLEVVFA